jgi:hypothetical protein
MDTTTAPPHAELLRRIFAKNVSRALTVVAKLRLADRLAPAGVE